MEKQTMKCSKNEAFYDKAVKKFRKQFKELRR
jgi:hypothetical protein